MSAPNDRFVCRLKAMRRTKGLSQSELALLAGVKRQAVYDMESGKYVPNTAVALRLARIFACRVEDLFSLDEPEAELPVTLVDCHDESGPRVAVARIGERLIGYPLDAKSLLGGSFQPAGGLVAPGGDSVRLLETEDRLEKTALLLGCDPAFAFLGAHIARKVSDAGCSLPVRFQPKGRRTRLRRLRTPRRNSFPQLIFIERRKPCLCDEGNAGPESDSHRLLPF